MQSENTSQEMKSKNHNKDAQNIPAQHIAVCKFFEQNRCKHGEAGVDCAFKHPNICKSYKQYGPTPQGCMQNNHCSLYHQKLCPGSIKSKQCFDTNCRSIHLKGTTRYKQDEHLIGDETESQSTNSFLDLRLKAVEAQMMYLLSFAPLHWATIIPAPHIPVVN